MLGILVGLKAEARLIRPYCPGASLAVSGATSEGAERGVQKLLDAGATALLSFGCAAGLAPDLKPGCLIVPNWVTVSGRRYTTDLALSERFGRAHRGVRCQGVLHSDRLVAMAAEKAALYAKNGCDAVDMESGFVARCGLPFAVLRVICDDSRRDLPPAARDVLSAGCISPLKLVRSLISAPGQIGALMALGRDASHARKAMAAFLRHCVDRGERI